jgi:hypothetical protein
MPTSPRHDQDYAHDPEHGGEVFITGQSQGAVIAACSVETSNRSSRMSVLMICATRHDLLAAQRGIIVGV